MRFAICVKLTFFVVLKRANFCKYGIFQKMTKVGNTGGGVFDGQFSRNLSFPRQLFALEVEASFTENQVLLDLTKFQNYDKQSQSGFRSPMG